METRANYVLIGAVTLFAILAGLGFFLWLAKAQIDKTYASYDVLFDSASGLGQASQVKFNGVVVGQVLTIELDAQDPSRVRVGIEVAAGTPIRQGTVATLESQGVTGVSFVGLEGGTPDAPRLEIDPAAGVPVIPSKPSVVQGLIETAPDLLNEAVNLLRDLSKFTSDENRDAVTKILKNVELASAKLDAAMSDVTRVTDSVAKAADQVTAFAASLDGIKGNADGALTAARDALKDVSARLGTVSDNANAALTAARDALKDVSARLGTVSDNANAAIISAKDTLKTVSGRIDTLSSDAANALGSVKQSLKGFEKFGNEGLPRITGLATDAGRLIDALTRLTAQISRDPARFFLGNRTPEFRQ